MQNKKQTFFILGIALIVVVAGVSAFTQERILRTGVEVILETRPVDPRDLLRGEYVILRYEIEVDPRVENFAMLVPPGSDIYVALSAGVDGVAEVSEVRAGRSSDMMGAWIRGEVIAPGEVRFPSLEQFYVPEGAGKPIEDLRDELHARVSIDDAGYARVVELLDGELNPIDPFEYRRENNDSENTLRENTIPPQPPARPVTEPIE